MKKPTQKIKKRVVYLPAKDGLPIPFHGYVERRVGYFFTEKELKELFELESKIKN